MLGNKTMDQVNILSYMSSIISKGGRCRRGGKE